MNMTMMRRLLLSTGSAAILAAGINAGSAQAQAPAEDQSTDIIVTANKRPERQLDVPSSITSFRGEDLLDKGYGSMRDYLALTPGVQFSQGAGSGAPVIRGLNSGQDFGALVGVVVDGAPIGAGSSFALGNMDTLDIDPIDLERVEILKGPQGTLYGANTLGGLVSYAIASPSLTKVTAVARGELSGTEHGSTNYSVRGAVSVPIVTDVAGLRLSAYRDRPGGFVDNDVQGQANQNDGVNWGVSGTLLMKPDSRLTVKLSGFYQRIGYAILDHVIFDADHKPINGLHYDDYLSPTYRKTFKVGVGSVDYDLGFATLSSVTGYQRMRAQTQFNGTHSEIGGTIAGVLPAFGAPTFPSPTIVDLRVGQNLRRFTQEVRLTSSGDGPFQYVLGGYYNNERVTGPNYIQALLPDLTPVAGLDPALGFDLTSTFKEFAGFANLTYKFSDAFDLTGGLRIGRIRQTYRQQFLGSSADAFNALLAFVGAPLTPADTGITRGSSTVKTWLATARYHFAPDGMVYARFATGFRPGGPNIQVAGLPLTYKPDKTTNYEMGVKSKFLDGLGTIDINSYYMIWDDILVQAGVGGISGLANGGRARVYGVEGSLTINPLDGLSLAGTLAYSKGKITRVDPLAAASLGKGDVLPNNPTWSGSIVASYRKPVSDNATFAFDASAKFVGSRHASYESSAIIADYVLPGYTVIDMSAGVELEHVDIKLFVRNLTDKLAQLSATTRYLINDVTVQRPRTIGATVTFRY